MKTLLSFLAIALIPALSYAEPELHTPEPGSEERTALMDALRVPVEKELKQSVVFKIDHLKVKGSWAFMRGVPQRPNDKKIDYSKTKYKTAIDGGYFDDGICALFKRTGGEWSVVAFVIGATDVPYVTWDQDYKAPKAIFE